MTGSRGGSAELSAVLATLDAELIRLHGTREVAKLSRAHERAAKLLTEPGTRRFHLTHAWVHALEAGEEDRATELARAILNVGDR